MRRRRPCVTVAPHELRPLAGVRVVEVATHVFVPMAGTVLTEWGAEVVKVEHPEAGDPYRHLVTAGLHSTYRGVDTFFQSANRGKRSVTLDLAQPEGRALLGRLVEQADVFATSLRPGACTRLGIDLDGIRRDNPSVIYVRATAFGPRGPDAGRGGYDATAYWARSGMQHLLSPPDVPFPPAPRAAFGDVVGALAIAGAVSAALYRRAQTGEPSVVDTSLLATGMWQVQADLVNAAITEEEATPGERARTAGDEDDGAGAPAEATAEGAGAVGRTGAEAEAPPSTTRAGTWNPLMLPYRTADGRFVALTMITPDRHWPRFCRAIGHPELAGDPRFTDIDARRANAAACVAALDAAFAERTYDEWCRALAGFEGEWAPVQRPAEVLDDPQVRANGYVAEADLGDGSALPLVTTPVQFDERPGAATRAPEQGQHTEEVLLELGLTWDQLTALKDRNVIL